jgi:hypothetical protein
MAVDFDGFPFYDDLIKKDSDKMSDVWSNNLATFLQTLTEYLNQYGIFVPRLTTAQRNTIQAPVDGQLIYNTSLNKFQGRESGVWVNLV